MGHHEGEQILDVTIEAVRDRFHTLNVPLAYFDGPAGTQVPDSVLEAVSGYLLAANANAGGKFLTSMVTDDVIASARAAASDLLGVMTDEVIFGANMTSLNFHLSRTASRDWAAGDEVVVTKLDHDANVAPWLEIAHDKGVVVKLAEIDDECRIDLDHLRSLVTERTKVVAFPMASNAVGTITPAKEIVEIAHAAGALAWVDAVHYAPHGDIEIPEIGCDVLLCSPYKFFGPHLGLAWVRREVSEGWRPYKVRPAERRAPGSGTRRGRCRTSSSAGSSPASSTCTASAGRSSPSTSASSGSGSSTGCRTAGSCTARRRWRAACRRSASRRPDETPADAAARLGAAGFAVWDGNYYAIEVFKHLGLRGRRDPGRHRPHEHGGRGRPAARGNAAAVVAEKDYSGTPLGKKLGREARGRGRRLLHDAQVGARGSAAGVEGDARAGRRAVDRLAEEGGEARDRPRLRRGAVGRASRRASSTTRAARSTRAGRRSGSCTGSPTARRPRARPRRAPRR